MNRQRTAAAFVLTLALSLASPAVTFAATQPRAESSDFNRDDRDSVLARTLRTIKHFIIKAFDSPMFPPPTSNQ